MIIIEMIPYSDTALRIDFLQKKKHETNLDNGYLRFSVILI